MLLLHVQFYITPVADSSRDGDGSRLSNSSVRIHKLKPQKRGAVLFPKLDECAHFHYEFIELQQIEVCV